MRTRTRMSLLAGITVLLTLVGSGAAIGLWSSSTTLGSTAKAATVGITQTVAATPTLTTTYSSTALKAASPITLANTGNRSATYTLSLFATSTTDAALPGAVSIAAAVVAATSDCTTTATLTSPTTGVFSTTTAFTASGTFAAGASVIVCVQTSMTAITATTYAQKSLTFSITGTTTLGTWTASTAAISITQNVAASLLFFTNSSGRYNIISKLVQAGGNPCVVAYQATLVRNNGCAASAAEWRLTAYTNGNFYITDAGSGGSGNNWALPSSTGTPTVSAPAATAAQRWSVTAHPDGTSFRIVNEQYGTCAYVSAEAANNPNSGRYILKAAVCDSSDAQAFSFTSIGAPVPTVPNLATCAGGNGTNYINYTWPVATGYQAEITYKVYIGGVFITDYTNGHSTSINLYNNSNPLVTIAMVGSGTKVLEIKQSISGSAFTTSALGSIYIQPVNGNLKCTP